MKLGLKSKTMKAVAIVQDAVPRCVLSRSLAQRILGVGTNDDLNVTLRVSSIPRIISDGRTCRLAPAGKDIQTDATVTDDNLAAADVEISTGWLQRHGLPHDVTPKIVVASCQPLELDELIVGLWNDDAYAALSDNAALEKWIASRRIWSHESCVEWGEHQVGSVLLCAPVRQGSVCCSTTRVILTRIPRPSPHALLDVNAFCQPKAATVTLTVRLLADVISSDVIYPAVDAQADTSNFIFASLNTIIKLGLSSGSSVLLLHRLLVCNSRFGFQVQIRVAHGKAHCTS
jgi:hypothetical protein